MTQSQGHTDKRIVRVLLVLRLIQEEPRQWTRARLSEHFEVSTRQMDKDLKALQLAGYDIRRHVGGYSLHDASGTEVGVSQEETRQLEQARAERHRRLNRERGRRRMERLRAAGLCLECGKVPPSPGHVRCGGCLADAALRAERWKTGARRA